MNLIFENGIWSFANAEIWVGIGLILFFGILVAVNLQTAFLSPPVAMVK